MLLLQECFLSALSQIDDEYEMIGVCYSELLTYVSDNDNRPLAKLSKAVKVADTGNQGKAESKALSAVTVTLREDTESFKKTDGVFNKDTFS